MEISENREMYLLSIANLVESRGQSLVPLNVLADQLEITPVSANEMIRKLSEEGYVRYLPYKGVELLEKGHAIALDVLRHRLLWEVFLVEKLGLNAQEADAIACRLEHITSRKVAQRLYEFLGRPSHSPQGKRIPNFESKARMPSFIPLGDAAMEEVLEVAQIAAQGAEMEFLLEEGIHPGARLRKLASGSHAELLLEVDRRKLMIGADLANLILVVIPTAKK